MMAGGVTSGGEAVAEITLNNGRISCQILTYGAILRTLYVPDREGNPLDVVTDTPMDFASLHPIGAEIAFLHRQLHRDRLSGQDRQRLWSPPRFLLGNAVFSRCGQSVRLRGACAEGRGDL